MTRSLVLRSGGAFAAAVLVPLIAAGAQCTGGIAVQDACQKTIDLVSFLSPQFSGALAGGSATMGQGGALGGLGTAAITLRMSGVSGSLPRIADKGFSLTQATATQYSADARYVPAISVDGAFGLFEGFPVGATYVGGIDALVSATYMRQIDNGQVHVTLAGSNTNFGFGGGLSIIKETPDLPGIGVTYLKRDMPRFSVTGTVNAGSGAGGTIAINDLLVTTTAIRLTGAKGVGNWRFSAGLGTDQYRSDAKVLVTVQPGQSGSAPVDFSMNRTNVFVGASRDILVFRISAEAGMVSGGSTQPLVNDFGSASNKSRTYFTIGVGLGIGGGSTTDPCGRGGEE